MKEPFIMENDEVRIPRGSQKIIDLAFKNGEFSKVTSLTIETNYDGGGKLRYLPKEIEKFTNLQRLIMDTRELTELPKEIGKLSHLKVLILSHNKKLTSLPKEIGNLKKLEELFLRFTGLTSLPKEMATLPHLRHLNFTNTPMKKLPEEFFKYNALPKLVSLNYKTGTIPLAKELEKYRPKILDDEIIVEKAENEEDVCQVCMLNKANYVNTKCGHLVSCGECVELLDQCPYCRTRGAFTHMKNYKGKIYKPI